MRYDIVKKILFRLEPELAHRIVTGLGLHSLSVPGLGLLKKRFYQYESGRLSQNIAGLHFPNPVGMAAGFDKTGELYPFLAEMGFGFVESGTFTAHAQEGNPKPRLFRYPEAKALINRMGFNNPGSEAVSEIIRAHKRPVPRGINIGKSKITPLPESSGDYLMSLRRLADYADYLAVNISSPNTPGLRKLQQKSEVKHLLGKLQEALHKRAGVDSDPLPLFVKLAPDMELSALDDVVAIALELELAGIILTNTTLDHSPVPTEEDQTGGLSGLPLRKKSTEFVRHAYRASEGRLAIIGVGGIFSAEDAMEKIRAGASLIQIYTGYIYEGPSLPRLINEGMDLYLKKHSLSNISELVGIDARKD